MKIYFLSSQPCALSLNGLFFGTTDNFERFTELDPTDKIYAQFSPEGALPVGFFITEEILSTPPSGCEVYLLRDGVAIYAKDFPPSDFTLRPILQQRDGNRLATLFRQGNLQLTIESPLGFFNTHLPHSFQPTSLHFHGEYLLLEGENTLTLFTLEGKQLLFERVIEYSLSENVLSATIPLSDRLQRQAKCEWSLTDNGCHLTSFTLLQPTTGNQPPADLLAYAFFESVLIGADFASFLSDDLIPDAERIRAFLGDFTAVTLTNKPTVCGLVRKKKERLFTLDYFSVEIQNGKIVDVKG